MNGCIPPDDRPTFVGCRDLLDGGWLEDTVLKTREADLRAHQIALTYSKYAIHLDDLIHGDASVRRVAKRRGQITTCNTNWFHYATWGTVTITRNIAHQRAPQRLDDLLPIALRRRLTPALIRERAANGQRVSRALAWSQRLIFITTTYTLRQFDTWMTDESTLSLPFELTEETKRAIKLQSTYELNRNGASPPPPAGGESSDGESLPDHEIDARESPAGDESNDVESPTDDKNDDVESPTDDESNGRRSPVGQERHLDPIQQAFRYYQQAANERDPDTRARLILGANVLLTAAEQDLAQSAVATVVNHMPQRFMNGIYQRTAKAAEMWTGVPRQIVGLQLPTRLAEVHDLVDTLWSRLMTDQVLVMTLPTETLRLGRDIPPRNPALPFYPPPLRHLDHPVADRVSTAPTDVQKYLQEELRMLADRVSTADIDEPEKLQADLLGIADRVSTVPTDEQKDLQANLQEIAEMVQSFDRARANGRGSAARDWRLFADRMNWAVALMRSRQQDETLFWPPYSTADESRIVDGQLPYRAGDPSELEVQAPSDYFLDV